MFGGILELLGDGQKLLVHINRNGFLIIADAAVDHWIERGERFHGSQVTAVLCLDGCNTADFKPSHADLDTGDRGVVAAADRHDRGPEGNQVIAFILILFPKPQQAPGRGDMEMDSQGFAVVRVLISLFNGRKGAPKMLAGRFQLGVAGIVQVPLVGGGIRLQYGFSPAEQGCLRQFFVGNAGDIGRNVRDFGSCVVFKIFTQQLGDRRSCHNIQGDRK